MEWGIAGKPFYYHTERCRHDCGGECMGCDGSRIAQDAADVVRGGWEPNSVIFPVLNRHPDTNQSPASAKHTKKVCS
jgi:hypothetical protein